MKKALAFIGASVATLGAFAEEAAGGIDLTPATTFLTTLTNSLKDWIQTNSATIFTVAGALLVFWLVGLILRIVKGLGNKAK